MGELRKIYLGDLRAMLDDPFWMSDAGLTFFRALPDETREDVISSMYSFAHALYGGDDNAVVEVGEDPAAVVTSRTYAFAELALQRLCRAAATAREDRPSTLRPPDAAPITGHPWDRPDGWVRLAKPESESDGETGDLPRAP